MITARTASFQFHLRRVPSQADLGAVSVTNRCRAAPFRSNEGCRGWRTHNARGAGEGEDILGKIASGVDPRTSARKPDGDTAEIALPSIAKPTLRIAWERYRDGDMKNKGRSDGTINNNRDHIERLSADWLDEPFSKLGRDPSLVNV
ncbi:hypothetical protein ACFX5Q_22865 [Mesorhizobium sp. IMUNJ 23033]|uniref:hypothetical protein n=1 Tax=Mesorhizobium sp. IMUNJ 23033 TaxID=3378039 RepID=UPI00384D3A21